MVRKEILYYMLAENIERGLNFVDSLLPFFEYCLSESMNQQITSESIKEIIEKNFPFGFPLATYEYVIDQFESQDKLVMFEHDGVVCYEPKKGFHTHNIEQRKKDIQYSIDKVAKEFCDFAQEIGKEYNEETAKKVISNFLINNIQSVLSPSYDSVSNDLAYSEDDRIVSLFIVENENKSYDLNRHLTTMIKGVVCYYYLYYKEEWDDLKGTSSRDIKKLKVFFDTPLVIYALGFSGELRRKLACELIEQLNRFGAEVYCFEHSLIELSRILSACEHIIDCRGTGKGPMRYTVEYFMSQEYPKTKILTIQADIRNYVESNSLIKIFGESPYESDPENLPIDETVLSKKLTDKNGYSVETEERIANDARSINMTAYYSNKRANDLQSIGAIFVTNNQFLVSSANDYLRDLCSSSQIIYHYAGLSARLLFLSEVPEPDLPIYIIMETCYAAVAPNEQQWEKYISNLNKGLDEQRIEEHQYLRLRSSKISNRQLFINSLSNEPTATISLSEALRLQEEVDQKKVADAILEVQTEAENRNKQVLSEKSKLEQELDESEKIIAMYKAKANRKAKNKIRNIKIFLVVFFVVTNIVGVQMDFWGITSPMKCIIMAASGLISILSIISLFFPSFPTFVEKAYFEKIENSEKW